MTAPRDKPWGTLYGIGVGPGDPELLTLKGYRLLRSAAVVFVPRSEVSARSYALEIAREFLDPSRQQVIELTFAMRAPAAEMEARWEANAQLVAAHLRAGRDAAFLTEGDPSLYSTFTHLAGALSVLLPGAAIVVVPGISSFQAAAAATGIPLADHDERLAVLPATYEREALRAALETFDTVVLLKVARVFDQLLDLLGQLGLVESTVYVRRCGRPEEEIICDVASLRGNKLDYFSLLIIRKRWP